MFEKALNIVPVHAKLRYYKCKLFSPLLLPVRVSNTSTHKASYSSLVKHELKDFIGPQPLRIQIHELDTKELGLSSTMDTATQQ